MPKKKYDKPQIEIIQIEPASVWVGSTDHRHVTQLDETAKDFRPDDFGFVWID